MKDLERWLLEDGLVSSTEMERARLVQEDKGIPLSMALIELDLLAETDIVDLVSRRHQIPKAPRRLYKLTIPPKALTTIPQDHCWQNGVFPFGIDVPSKTLQVAILDPRDPEAITLLQRLPGGLEAELYIAGPRQLEKAIRKHFLDSIVEDTNSPGLRFFGYEGVTSPGMSKGRSIQSEPDLDNIVLAEPDTSPVTASAPAPEPALTAPTAAAGQGELALPPARAPTDQSLSVSQDPLVPPTQTLQGVEEEPVKPFRTAETVEDRQSSSRDQHRSAIARLSTSSGVPDGSAQIEQLTRRIAALERAVMNLLQLMAHSHIDLSDKAERIAGSLSRDIADEATLKNP